MAVTRVRHVSKVGVDPVARLRAGGLRSGHACVIPLAILAVCIRHVSEVGVDLVVRLRARGLRSGHACVIPFGIPPDCRTPSCETMGGKKRS